MFISDGFKFAVAAAAVIASTSSVFAIDAVLEQQMGQAGLNNSRPRTAQPGVRTGRCPLVKWNEDRTVATVVPCGLAQKPL
jgi:hypothetical protein